MKQNKGIAKRNYNKRIDKWINKWRDKTLNMGNDSEIDAMIWLANNIYKTYSLFEKQF